MRVDWVPLERLLLPDMRPRTKHEDSMPFMSRTRHDAIRPTKEGGTERMSEPTKEQVQVYGDLVKGADEVIVAKVSLIDFYERFSEGGKTIVYFGTEQSFKEWKKSRGN